MVETLWKFHDIDSKFIPLQNGINPIVQKVLFYKGITEAAEMEEFLSPKPKKTYNPFLMRNMEEASALILQYIREKKNIWIYGDYDVDGVASIALLMDFLSRFTDHLHYYIPLRAEEGYGLNCDAIQEIKNNGADLIITVDCGSTSVKEVALAKSLGMEIIITDHHNLSEEKPDCLILNPKQEDCPYPFKLLCGCGIAFKLAQALQKKLDAPKTCLNEILDLVALATVADVVPLIDENRTMLKYGLQRMTHTTRHGLNFLIQSIGLGGKKITAYHIGYILGPHFNASGRIDDARAGVELLLAKEPDKIVALTQHLIACNDERKLIQDQGLELCRERVEKEYQDDLFLVVDSGITHEGVIGIIAGRIRDIYYKPTLVVTEAAEEGILKGSGRSIEGLDIYEELKKCADLFLKFGGHKNACGFSIEKDKLNLLRQRLNLQAREIIENTPDIFRKSLKIYGIVTPPEITEKLVEDLERIEPYGMGNEKPLFLIPNLKAPAPSDLLFMGKSKEHIKLRGISGNKGTMDAIGFGLADFYINHLNNPAALDLLGFPCFNEWNGHKSIQFMISDMKRSSL
ncbi:single-stranded-DNA-specific exonuclease RecJ [Geosporobacter ferrireducens]|uniref:Single-stranded-DNA-specific exonuclease RecJ n=1 Tax=Geosporobacter ferrireducens TaxID=1424294 RepID=A0A1D8GFT9_9FIRM|nr:single-stranded-DNA-specific exonuclease RecJ [Geosporobacter ferrireducens]AOT69781.1 single-stranded-DNA-specific exonuclease RecJ [Geosporobacter ferrireducens]MTI54506.1 single-stranded-DNA-specific exonuclease RecJ [Geosporobacter ferrireducens]